MIRYILKRILLIIPVMLGVVLLVFSMLYFSPGEPEDYILGDMATEEDKAIFREENGLNDPFLMQYARYVINSLKGDLGISYTTKLPVATELMQRFPITFRLALFSTILGAVLGIAIGVLSAVKQDSWIDSVTRLISMVGVSMPNFWYGLLLILLFSVYLGWLPSSGFATWKHWILPIIPLGTTTAASIMRMTRSSMLESIRQDYVRTARAKGQKKRTVIWQHAFRNAVIPVITTAGFSFGSMLGGSALTETVFAIPGLGNLIISAIKVKNAPLVQGGVLLIAVSMAVVNLIVDIMYAFVDPRIKSQYESVSVANKLKAKFSKVKEV